ncbi:Hypothetical protein GbCGDNIH9_5106 [Granulibacter bethesdensis]|uniref:Uncharacterized protein n=1 Tax=Granulibacter bethesdensis TaxID=364410 RepID=A0AAC9K760_9PROT|nr:hypothetical protein [Granulibacter bethesdensis]APH54145.1 Hypothetical protein GbCGDNIH9_5106 [Granulibacter bethesdensis]APH61727.1 Hypothetical protein GbCGDNIH8_5106 [Granulibacter bethesdensis]
MSEFLSSSPQIEVPGGPRFSRRLADKILSAFHQACDQNELDVADRLLKVLEMMMSRRASRMDVTRRRSIEALVAAHERLWHLRHPGGKQF